MITIIMNAMDGREYLVVWQVCSQGGFVINQVINAAGIYFDPAEIPEIHSSLRLRFESEERKLSA